MKREDLTAAMNPLGIDNKEYRFRVNLEDKYVKKLVDDIQALKQKEFDAEYWTYRLLTIQMNNGQTKTVALYLLTPFSSRRRGGIELLFSLIKM